MGRVAGVVASKSGVPAPCAAAVAVAGCCCGAPRRVKLHTGRKCYCTFNNDGALDTETLDP